MHHLALLKTSKNLGMAHFNQDHHLCLPHFGAHPPKKAALNSVLGSGPFENPNAPTLQNTRVLHALYSTGQPLLRVKEDGERGENIFTKSRGRFPPFMKENIDDLVKIWGL